MTDESRAALEETLDQAIRRVSQGKKPKPKVVEELKERYWGDGASRTMLVVNLGPVTKVVFGVAFIAGATLLGLGLVQNNYALTFPGIAVLAFVFSFLVPSFAVITVNREAESVTLRLPILLLIGLPYPLENVDVGFEGPVMGFGGHAIRFRDNLKNFKPSLAAGFKPNSYKLYSSSNEGRAREMGLRLRLLLEPPKKK